MSADISKDSAGLHYPFSAVVGQETFKLALLLAAVNPALGGVVVSGPRGCAKSTLVRALADLLPQDTLSAEGKPAGQLVTLPLGASEEMLLGSLDLQQVLDQQQVAFRPGLLSRAHGGVLYVDEVNLLPDTLVDQLLDVCASGINRIERDGISHSHKAEFLLIGTMNPEEGELRPQLLDRFGLCVRLDNRFSLDERMQIVRLREAFDRDPAAFCQQRQEAQQALRQLLNSARQLLPEVRCSEQLRRDIARRCDAAQVDGLRADLVWLRAACAQAALHQRTQVEVSDLDAVEELVLAHRRQAHKPDSGSGSETANKAENRSHASADNTPENQQEDQLPFQRPAGSRRPLPEQPPLSGVPLSDSQLSDPQLSDPQLSGSQLSAPQLSDRPEEPGLQNSPLTPFAERGQAGLLKPATGSAAQESVLSQNLLLHLKAPVAKCDSPKQRVHWLKTLLNSRGELPLKQLLWQSKPQPKPVLHLVLLDTSGSLHSSAFLRCKQLVQQIARLVYQKRQQLAIIGFGNQQVKLLLPGKKAPSDLSAWLQQLPAGGGTPLRQALEQAALLLQQKIRQQPELVCRNYLLTDGRSSAGFQGLALNGDSLLIDTEQGPVKRGRAPELAQQLGAGYLTLAECFHTGKGR